MPITTFTLSPPTVPPIAAVGNGTPTTGLAGASNETPAGWPSSGDATAFEVELTATTAPQSDGLIQVVVSDASTAAEVPGTWSGDSGTVSTWPSSDATEWEFDKFGAWRTSYLTFSLSSASSNLAYSLNDAALDLGEIDIRVRCRRSDWTSPSHGATLGSRSSQRWILRIFDDELRFQFDDDSTTHSAACPLSSLGLVDGAWAWLRVTYEEGTVRFYSSADGSSWLLGATVPAVGAGTVVAGGNLRIGNGLNASGINQRGFGGDISDFEIRTFGGALVWSLRLDAMDSSTDSSWTSGGSAALSVVRESGVGVTGVDVPESRRTRFEFDEPTAMTAWRMWVSVLDGEVTFDEIVLEYVSGRQRRFVGTLGR